MTSIRSVDARTGEVVETVAEETTPADLDHIVGAAATAAATLADSTRSARARMLRSISAALEAERDQIVRIADRETALGSDRLKGELTRTTGQFEHFADVVEDGAYLEVAIDHATSDSPELRRWLRPMGPVAVFGASNFPLAFSVPGGDTASALAAGCPVVAKAHPSHPATSMLAAAAIQRGIEAAGLPPAGLGIVHGVAAGAALVGNEQITAVGFTGSVAGGRALFDIAQGRPDPIPFHGELGSINPVVVSEGAARRRGQEIAHGFVDSFTLGSGQFCTKPGLLFVPKSTARELVGTVRTRVRDAKQSVLLNSSIEDAYVDRIGDLAPLFRRVGVEGSVLGSGSSSGAVASAGLR